MAPPLTNSTGQRARSACYMSYSSKTPSATPRMVNYIYIFFMPLLKKISAMLQKNYHLLHASCKLITLKNKSDLAFFFICAICTDQKAAGVIGVIPVGESLRERKLKMIIKCFTGLCQG